MASDTGTSTAFYNEQGNSNVNNYFSQLSSGSSGQSSSGSSNSSSNSVNSRHQAAGSNPASVNCHWNEITNSPQHHSHHHHQQQQQQPPQSQLPQQHPQHDQQQQQQSAASNQNHNLPQNHPTTPTSAHPLFSGNFHHRTNNPWGLPNLSCYQRIYGENPYHQNFHHQMTHASVANNENIGNHQSSIKRLGNFSGKSGNSKDICGDDKFKEDGDPWNVEAQAAFLGPNLWDKTLPYDADLKVTQYADLDEFLSENNIPDGLPGTHLGHPTSLGHRSDSLGHSTGLSLGLGHVTTKRERSPSPSDCVSPDTINPPSPAESTFSFASSGRDFDPRTRAFSDEELKPQPMIKKSRKQFVPDELKDDKYWARRRKNNIAAKRSRDARRQKENQIAMRARYLEKENSTLHQEVEQLKQENMELRARLSKYQEV